MIDLRKGPSDAPFEGIRTVNATGQSSSDTAETRVHRPKSLEMLD